MLVFQRFWLVGEGGYDMHSLSGYNITLTRGDSLILNLTLTKNGETYTPDEEDVIRFALKRRYTDEDSAVLINKVIDNETLQLEIEPDDTKSLLMGHTYVYDIELTDSNGRVDTFISGTLTIDNEVY